MIVEYSERYIPDCDRAAVPAVLDPTSLRHRPGAGSAGHPRYLPGRVREPCNALLHHSQAEAPPSLSVPGGCHRFIIGRTYRLLNAELERIIPPFRTVQPVALAGRWIRALVWGYNRKAGTPRNWCRCRRTCSAVPDGTDEEHRTTAGVGEWPVPVDRRDDWRQLPNPEQWQFTPSPAAATGRHSS